MATDRRDNWQGMNWCRPSTRLAIYLRDGLSCCWCGASVEDGIRLTLDHCKPDSKNGSNSPRNLITSCSRCNSSRGDRGLREFAAAVGAYTDRDPGSILRHVENCRKRRLPREEAREMLKRRGPLSRILSECITGKAEE